MRRTYNNTHNRTANRSAFHAGDTTEEEDNVNFVLDDHINTIVDNISRSISVDSPSQQHQQQQQRQQYQSINIQDNNTTDHQVIVEDLNNQRTVQPHVSQPLVVVTSHHINEDEEECYDAADDEFEEGAADSGSSTVDDVEVCQTTSSTTGVIDHTRHKTCYDSPDRNLSMRNVLRVLVRDAALLVFMIPVCYVCYLVPSTYLGDDKDLEFWNNNIPWSKYLLWISCITMGFAYVSVVTEERNYPFHCRYKRHRDFFQLLVVASVMFMLGPERTLMGPNDPKNHNIHIAFLYNYFAFVVPFVIGLHYTYLDHNLFLRSVGDKFGTPSLWYTYEPKELLTIIPIILTILCIIAWHIYLMIVQDVWIYFLVGYSIYFIVLIGVTMVWRKTHYLHLHHYFIFGSLIPLSAFQTIPSAICLGLITAITVEGIHALLLY
ncbi:hypothetical protein SAMD00019534_115650 [Acytostelium subglobosum LB1]|uniref:hypothetical protein n=1 Tax=Acytostelium subglobosum LB1 TaxID=1410327 RepID=UPI000644ECE3|nr:hypothetical protein SAMD00019534_115650 [Acytostelium subglobosum LB1]GAM28389.1 hypothetical protein SAMD00019534_115650 [Acytostelium subglobosum LB1]|eukprot:XP_012748706.1 hypothetical protein SAMD00019534_115650 [Acytostelium subglobosum LB1]